MFLFPAALVLISLLVYAPIWAKRFGGRVAQRTILTCALTAVFLGFWAVGMLTGKSTLQAYTSGLNAFTQAISDAAKEK
jgi:hypothetical protein